MNTFCRNAAIVTLVTLCAWSASAQFAITADHTNAIYDLGQTVHWRIIRAPVEAATSVKYTIKKGQQIEIASGELSLTNGPAELTSTLDEPGTLLAEVRWAPGPAGRALAGAVFAPDKIAPSTNCPADFDAFWSDKI